MILYLALFLKKEPNHVAKLAILIKNKLANYENTTRCLRAKLYTDVIYLTMILSSKAYCIL